MQGWLGPAAAHLLALLLLCCSNPCAVHPPTHLPRPGVTNLPAGITRLKQLACLDVSGCPLTFLPSQMWKLGSLRHLRLNGAVLGRARGWAVG